MSNEEKYLTSVVKSSDSNDSFVHVSMELDNDSKPSLELKVLPRYDRIGLQSKQESTQICATVTARDLPDDDESKRSPIDIVVALDISGSMLSRGKIDLCKETLKLLIRELRPSDRFGLVTFSSEAVLEIPTRKVNAENKQLALDKIKKLSAGGGTNMSGGIGLAAQELRSVENPNVVRTIFLLTDGHANEGICDKKDIVVLTKGCLETLQEYNPIAIHCFGYGADHDKTMLRDISRVTEGGTYYFVDTDNNVSSAFGDALGGILSVVSQNAVLSIVIPQEASEHGVNILDVHHKNKRKQIDGSFKINIGDFYAEETRDIVFDISLIKSVDDSVSRDEKIPHVLIHLSYMDTINKKLVESKSVVGSIARPNNSDVSPLNHHVGLQMLRINTANIIANAEEIGDRGDLSAAESKIVSYRKQLNDEASALGKQSDPLVVQMMDELSLIMTGLSSRSSYKSFGATYMQTRVQTHSIQRCSESSPVYPSIYRRSMKSKLAKKFAKNN